MLKTVIAKGDLENLTKLYEAYCSVNDENEILKLAGKLIQKAFKIPKHKLISIFDKMYEIIAEKRRVFRNVIDHQITETKKGNKKFVKFLKEYQDILSMSACDILKKIIKEIKKGILGILDDNVIINLIL